MKQVMIARKRVTVNGVELVEIDETAEGNVKESLVFYIFIYIFVSPFH